jgi:hypothetical protein
MPFQLLGYVSSEVLSYAKFKRPQKFESQNIHLSFWLKETLTDMNENIILALVYKDDCIKLHNEIYNAFF